jgi:hypothetical protein
MAELGDIQVAPNGQPMKLGPQGWKPISQQQAEAETMPAAGRFLGGLIGQDAPGVAGALGNIAGVGLAVGEPTVLLGRAGARAGASALRRQFGGRPMADRVQTRIQQTVRPEQGITPFEAQRGAGGLAVPRAADTGVGAAQAGVTPPPAGLGARILDKFLDQRPLKTDQARIVQSGRAEQLGFRFLPGQREGQNLLLAGAKSDPIVAGAFDDIFTANREAGANLARKALGLDEGTQFGRAELGQAADDIGARLNQVADDIDPVALDADLTRRVNRLRKVDDDLDDALDDVLGKAKAGRSETVSGEELLALRSQLGATSRQAWRQGASQRAKRVDKIIAKLDDLIEQASNNPAAKADFRKAREQWRVLLQLEKPGIVSEAGDIGFERLAGRFTREFKGDFARSTFARPDSRLSQETKDLLDFTKIGGAFKDNIGDSGTATRLGLQALLNPKQLTQRLILKQAAQQLVRQGQ